ncbi:MAG: CopD family protein [Anaerolineaceae bacterium]|nr:CopD family protein [Anaerolineaceae bacterium]MCY3907498.1 CopD family protein [Anaerolineaceae bacterium]
MSPSLLAPSLFLHLLATVFWLGGLFLLTLLVWPETRRSLADNPQRYRLLDRLRQRFQPFSWISMVVLLVTGLFQMTANPHYEGMLQFSNPWSRAILLKHVAMAGMAICGLLLQWRVAPALRRAGWLLDRGGRNAAEWQRLRRQEVRLARISVALGLLVLLFTAMATAL